jgi:hypothetical protein
MNIHPSVLTKLLYTSRAFGKKTGREGQGKLFNSCCRREYGIDWTNCQSD